MSMMKAVAMLYLGTARIILIESPKYAAQIQASQPWQAFLESAANSITLVHQATQDEYDSLLIKAYIEVEAGKPLDRKRLVRAAKLLIASRWLRTPAELPDEFIAQFDDVVRAELKEMREHLTDEAIRKHDEWFAEVIAPTPYDAIRKEVVAEIEAEYQEATRQYIMRFQQEDSVSQSYIQADQAEVARE